MHDSVLFDNVASLMPQAAPMILIDKILACEDGRLEALVTHETPSLFTNAGGGVPVWVGVEYMAQAIAAYAGIKNRERGRPVSVGFLLGFRDYKAVVMEFVRGQAVIVRITEVYSDEEGGAVFDCEIHGDGLLASAQIKAIQPDDVDSILEKY